MAGTRLTAVPEASNIGVQILKQPVWSSPLVKCLGIFGSVDARSAAMAWLAHIHVLSSSSRTGGDLLLYWKTTSTGRSTSESKPSKLPRLF